MIIGNNYLKNKNIEVKVLHKMLFDDINIDTDIEEATIARYRGNQLMSHMCQFDWKGIKDMGFLHGCKDCKEEEVSEIVNNTIYKLF